ncbi:MAG: hypothetical protein GWO87_00220 [Xanthomonadaceae bacterium]|nr:hypothetical protein [Rhodospirillaceae bacterium]NIA17605.1 hypothetical protein [Xanthomonadaceae bacterium]
MFKKIFNIKRLNSFFSAILVFIIMEILVFYPSFILLLSLFIVGIIFFSVWRILPKSFSVKKEPNNGNIILFKIINISKIVLTDKNYLFFIAPFFLFLGAISFLLFLRNILFIHSSILLFSFFYFLFLETLFFYFYSPSFLENSDILAQEQKDYFIENIFTIIDLLSLFFIYSTLFSLLYLFNFSLTKIILLVIFVSFLSNHYLFFIYKVPDKISYLYNIIITLLTVEFFWGISFLPINFYVDSLILISVYYVIIGMAYFHFKKKLDKTKVLRHLLISLIIIILAMITAKWT